MTGSGSHNNPTGATIDWLLYLYQLRLPSAANNKKIQLMVDEKKKKGVI